MTLSLDRSEDLLYPQSDGKPMSESTEQYRWIVFFKENLEILFAPYASVFIAADLLWYPVQVSAPPAPSQAPDVMVIFGRPKGKRRSYQQWKEGNIPPQVVVEILSASNKTAEGEIAMDSKFMFYERYGVEEYYIYDPDEFSLEGWIRQGQRFTPIHEMTDWTSPRLGIRFRWQPRQELQVAYPDGRQFLTSLELREQADRAELQAAQAQLQASHARQQANLERDRADQAEQRADQAEQRAEEERQRAEEERQRAEEEHQRAEEERQRAQQAEAALAAERERLAQLQAQLQAQLERLHSFGASPSANDEGS